MTLSERIQTVLDELKDAGVDQVSLANSAGVSKGAVSQWLSGQIKSIKLEYALGIQEKYGYSAVWLVIGKGPKRAEIQHNDDYHPIPISESSYKVVAVVGRAQLGDNGYWADVEFEPGHGDGYIDFPSRDPDVYALKCVGDSMKPRIKDGEFVIVEPNHPAESGDEVLVKSKDGRVMVKTLAYIRAGAAHLLSVNEEHGTVKIAMEDIEKIHYVAAIVKASMWRPD